MSRLVLACTVGGSPAPVVAAIRDARPDHVLFAVTAADGGRPGSDAEVPGIVAAARLAAGAWEQLVVPPDDPDAAYARLAEAMRALRARFPNGRLLADYTGGTKSMSAALLAAALEQPGCDIQLMTGQRGDLRAVTHGTERPFKVNPGWLLAGREVERYRAAWRRFGYAEAEAGFRGMVADLETDEAAPRDFLLQLRDLRDLSAGFAAWDRFEHAAARDGLRKLARRHDGFLLPYLRQLDVLCAEDERGEGARIADLLLNARRRAHRGRYDDAVARLYRLIEWSQQWPLRMRHGIDTGDVTWARVPSDVLARLSGRMTGKGQIGLVDGVKLLAELEPDGAMAAFCKLRWPATGKKKTCQERLNTVLRERNYSILAHGTTPLGSYEWERFDAFVTLFVQHVLRPELARAGVPGDPPQLPTEPPLSLR